MVLCGTIPLVAALFLRHSGSPSPARVATKGATQAAAAPLVTEPAEEQAPAPEEVAEPAEDTTTTVPARTTRKARAVATTVRPRVTTTSTTSRPRSTTTTAPPTPTTVAKPATTTTSKPPAVAKPSATTPVAGPAPSTSHQQTGVASWYDTFAGTCAHVALPRGTIIKVTRLLTGASTTCRVADYGPTIPGRVIDLSKDVFAKLADPSVGVIEVRIEW